RSVRAPRGMRATRPGFHPLGDRPPPGGGSGTAPYGSSDRVRVPRSPEPRSGGGLVDAVGIAGPPPGSGGLLTGGGGAAAPPPGRAGARGAPLTAHPVSRYRARSAW